MKAWRFLLISLGVVLMPVLLVALVMRPSQSQAQGPDPQLQTQPMALLDSTFTYQGQLKKDGHPVNDTCDMKFQLYDDAVAGNPIGDEIQAAVVVTAGLFTQQLSFSSDSFTGEARWLEVSVQCSGDLGFFTLAPRQELTAAPYALSLRPGAVIEAAWPSGPLLTANNTATDVASSGLGGQTASTYGSGVVGYAVADSGVASGVTGMTNSDEGVGVYGWNTATSGTAHGVSGKIDSPSGYGVYGFANTSSGINYGVYGYTTSSDGWAGGFSSIHGNGVWISTLTAKVGLSVAGGSKNAVVRTADGSRLLYSEESSAVWFSDYGFGHLQDGVAIVPIDPVFAQTVNLAEPYHVFVQVYGAAEIYVTNRTPTQFEVQLLAGDAAAEFSYRLVAKRLGYEDARLERAPWADNDPNLYPELRPEAPVLP